MLPDRLDGVFERGFDSFDFMLVGDVNNLTVDNSIGGIFLREDRVGEVFK